MTTIAQTIDWFLEGFIGQIPVWNKAGQQVGYRTSYASMKVYFLEGFNNMPAGQQLVTKNFAGQDIPLVIQSVTQTKTPQGATQTTAAVQPVPVPPLATGTATQPTGTAVQPSVTTATNDLLTMMSQTVNIGGVQIPIWVFAAGAGGLVLYLMFKDK